MLGTTMAEAKRCNSRMKSSHMVNLQASTTSFSDISVRAGYNTDLYISQVKKCIEIGGFLQTDAKDISLDGASAGILAQMKFKSFSKMMKMKRNRRSKRKKKSGMMKAMNILKKIAPVVGLNLGYKLATTLSVAPFVGVDVPVAKKISITGRVEYSVGTDITDIKIQQDGPSYFVGVSYKL